MLKIGKAALAAASLALFAVPATAQDEEEPRTTWSVTVIDVKDGSQSRWEEIMMDHVVPAYEAAGWPAPQLHWTMANDDWDMVVMTEMPGGMGMFDHHNSRAPLFAAFVEQEGSEEAARALFEELDSLEDDSRTLFTHTHP